LAVSLKVFVKFVLDNTVGKLKRLLRTVLAEADRAG
jgi:hypothetical protein